MLLLHLLCFWFLTTLLEQGDSVPDSPSTVPVGLGYALPIRQAPSTYG